MANTSKKKTNNADSGSMIASVSREDLVQEQPASAQDKPLIPKDIDPSQYVVVRNGHRGRLVYISPRTNERFVWEAFGDEQEMELRELKSIKSNNKRFFTDNWFMFDEPWIVDYLGVRQYYKGAITIDHFDDIFKLTPDKITNALADVSNGQKKSIAYRARELIASGEIDSLKKIDALEKGLGVELIEK